MSETKCLHCGGEIAADIHLGEGFCCRGCQAAYNLIRGLGLDLYYSRRFVDPHSRLLKPEEDAPVIDYAAHVSDLPDGKGHALYLMVDGLQCAACVWLIEQILGRQPDVIKARLNMTTRRLALEWRGEAARANELAASVSALGYRLVPYDPAALDALVHRQEKELLRAMAVAGFAAANVMLLSVSVWAGHAEGMGEATRGLMHWVSALITMPAVAFAGIPFFRSAANALKAGRTNMDVPISLGVTLATGMSLAETIRGGEHAYFDSAITLLFFLLIGRYLDIRARGRARAAAEHLLALGVAAVTVLEEDGSRRLLPPNQVKPGMIILTAAGERIGIDGCIIEGRSDIDQSLITGESVPLSAQSGDRVFAGALNLSAPLRIEATAVGEGTFLAEIVRLMEAAEQGRARYVALADRVARLYAPVVHVTALATFLAWVFFTNTPWQTALLYSVAVLIITCPCALALAVPVVQVIAGSRLMRRGILLKTATALERLAEVDHVVFDKTGTLTTGRPEPILEGISQEDLRLAASLAGASKHPLARALVRACPSVPPAANVEEFPGQGLMAGGVRLGSRKFCEVPEDDGEGLGPELWLSKIEGKKICIAFRETPRADAASVVSKLQGLGYGVELLSGDRPAVAKAMGASLGILAVSGGLSPTGKCERLAELAAKGRKTLMVGDGLNDAPALAGAHVSLSPSSAVDVSQTAADAVFQGEKLEPVIEILRVSRRAELLVKQNFAISIIYNLFTVPLAMLGHVTPLIAAIAMSTSSLLVIANALRLGRGGKT
jgi:Cu2+-exporting ATPase